MSGLSGFLPFCFLSLLVAIFGFYNVLVTRQENFCNMTYMFEYPQYVKVSVGLDVARRFRAYNLYAYGEGRFTEKVREMKFSGIPVLFIHGHRGSYKQVRSVSSVSLRKGLHSRSKFHFDYFSIDLNEEHSGISGVVLDKQTDFTRICIERILSLYRGPNPPTSVVILAHSMGGMIAKGLFLRDMPWSRVRLIVTLATPHTPALLLDPATSLYYDEVNNFWDTSDVSANVTLISLGGGSRDLVVHSSLVFTPHADLSAVSSEVSDVWLEVDHLCITWCKEVMLVLVRALFDCVDLSTEQISTDVQHRLDVFSYHLLQRSGSKEYRLAGHSGGKEVVLWKGGSDGSTWLRLRQNQLTWRREDRVAVATHILIPLSQPADTLVIRTTNHKTESWLFSCNPDISLNNIKICSKGEDISWRGRISPSKDYKRKTAVLDLVSLKMEGKTHLVVRTLPTDEMVEISFDMLVQSERGRAMEVGWVSGETLVKESPPGQLMRWFQLPAMARPWHSYLLTVSSQPANCSYQRGFLATAEVKVPWNNEGSHLIFSEDKKVHPLTTYSPKPQGKGTKNVEVSIFLHPECSYTIRLEQSLALSLGRLILSSYPSLLASFSVCLTMVLSQQISCLGEKGDSPLLHFIVASAAKPYYVLPAANIIAGVARLWYPVVPKSDMHGQSGLVETLIVPLLLHCSAVALLLIISSLTLLGVVFHGQAFNSVILKFLSKLCLGLPWISEWIMSGVSKLPVIVSGLMLAISYSACSSLAIYIGLVFYFVKLVSYYEDFWDEVVYWPVRAVRSAVLRRLGRRTKPVPPLDLPPIRDISFHLTLFLMWGVVALVSTPSVLTWAHNYKFSSSLDNDPFFASGVVLSLCGAFLWQSETPRTHLLWSDEMKSVILSSCVGMLVYCQTSLYRLQAVVCTLLLTVCCHQFVSPSHPPQDDDNSQQQPSALSSATASFLRRLDSLLGNTPRPDSRISCEKSDTGSVSRVDLQTDRSESESSDRAEHSAELSTDLSADFSELSPEVSKMSETSVEVSKLSDTSIEASKMSDTCSFDPCDRPCPNDEEPSSLLLPVIAGDSNTASISSNSSFENISIAELKDK